MSFTRRSRPRRDQSGFYRSENGGESWAKRSAYIATSPQYYQELVADPRVFDRVYAMDTLLHVSDDGGKTFRPLGERWKHVDNHALWIDPQDSDHLLIGCDGGLYETWDRGQSYRYSANLPITQFYKIAVDNDAPFYNVYGGTQDNATQGGPSRTNNVHGIRNSDWFVTVFGDGFDPVIDPTNPNIIYSQWQYGGLVRYDRRSGERIDIKPQEDKNGPPLRWNWDSALIISPHSPTRLYYGSQILFRSDDRGDTWKAISPDLTRNIDRNKLKVMGRVWSVDAVAKNDSTSFYGTIVALAESPLVEGLIYAGTDDGLIQVTEDGGRHWRKVESFPFTNKPEDVYVSDIETSRHDPNTVYACFDNHKNGDFKPYVLRSTDRGKTWTNIGGDLPERGSAYTIAVDHVTPDLLFVGTEFGVFASRDGGQHWQGLKSGMPPIAVRDLEIQRRESDLVVGTFGRGIYILDDYSPLRDLTKPIADKPAAILPIKKALLYIPAAPLAGGEKAFQGASFYTAPNPPFGATFTYHLKEALKTKKAARREQEQKLERESRDVFYPPWEALKAEDREEPAAVDLDHPECRRADRPPPGRTGSGGLASRRLGPALARLSAGDRATETRAEATMTRDSAAAERPAGPAGEVHRYPGEARRAGHDRAGHPRRLRSRAAELRDASRPDREAVMAFAEQTGELQRAALGALEALERRLEPACHHQANHRPNAKPAPEAASGRAQPGAEAAGPARAVHRRSDQEPPQRAGPGRPDRADRDHHLRPLVDHFGPDHLAPQELRDRRRRIRGGLEEPAIPCSTTISPPCTKPLKPPVLPGPPAGSCHSGSGRAAAATVPVRSFIPTQPRRHTVACRCQPQVAEPTRAFS